MAKNYLKRGIAAFAVVVLSLAPAFGSVCDMPCGSGGEGAGGSCCCQSAGASANEVLANPSCCSEEVKTYDPGTVARATVSARSLELVATPFCTAEETTYAADLQPAAACLDSPGNARSSPLFLLHAAFII